jgi:hypothetical protein
MNTITIKNTTLVVNKIIGWQVNDAGWHDEFYLFISIENEEDTWDFVFRSESERNLVVRELKRLLKSEI